MVRLASAVVVLIGGMGVVCAPAALAPEVGSAVTAVRQWKYKPYLLMGQPVAVRTQIQVNYQLSN